MVWVTSRFLPPPLIYYSSLSLAETTDEAMPNWPRWYASTLISESFKGACTALGAAIARIGPITTRAPYWTRYSKEDARTSLVFEISIDVNNMEYSENGMRNIHFRPNCHGTGTAPSHLGKVSSEPARESSSVALNGWESTDGVCHSTYVSFGPGRVQMSRGSNLVCGPAAQCPWLENLAVLLP